MLCRWGEGGVGCSSSIQCIYRLKLHCCQTLSLVWLPIFNTITTKLFASLVLVHSSSRTLKYCAVYKEHYSTKHQLEYVNIDRRFYLIPLEGYSNDSKFWECSASKSRLFPECSFKYLHILQFATVSVMYSTSQRFGHTFPFALNDKICPNVCLVLQINCKKTERLLTSNPWNP